MILILILGMMCNLCHSLVIFGWMTCEIVWYSWLSRPSRPFGTSASFNLLHVRNQTGSCPVQPWPQSLHPRVVFVGSSSDDLVWSFGFPQKPLVYISFIQPSTTITTQQVDVGVDAIVTKIVLEMQLYSCKRSAMHDLVSVMMSCQHFCHDLSVRPWMK